jgi:hypothetical protein
MLHAIWKGGSLRSWIALGMAVAVLPLATSAFFGYSLLSRGVLASFQDIAARQREQIDPTQRLRLLIVGASAPLDDFMDEGDPRDPLRYRGVRRQVEAAFASLHTRMSADAELGVMVERARDDWTAADRLATEAMSVHRVPGDPHGAELMDGFHGLAASSADKLGAVYDQLAGDLHRDYDTGRSGWH